MTSRLGRRIIHFANLPIKLQLPQTLTKITEFSLRTIPSATKIEIKRVLESLYGFHVDKVRTLNMDGKMKKRGGLVIARPDYKKAYVTLKTPLEVPRDSFPVRVIEEERKRVAGAAKAGKSGSGGVSVVEADADGRRHWLDDRNRNGERERDAVRDGYVTRKGNRTGAGPGRFSRVNVRGGSGEEKKWNEMLKFPWSSLRTGGGGGQGSGN